MASFQAKTGWERSRKSENKNHRSDHFLFDPYLRCEKRNSKKKFKNLKTPFRLFFKGKTGWHRPRRSENKNYRSDHFLPDS